MRNQPVEDFTGDRCSFKTRAEKSKWAPKLGMVAIHVVYVGGLFALDTDSINLTVTHPWYVGSYLFLVALTLFQYFFTAGSQPGYVADVLNKFKEVDVKGILDVSSRKETQGLLQGEGSNYGTNTNGRWPSSSGTGSRSESSALIPFSNRNIPCPYCGVWQPLRTKHCYDCERCVLRFDHHCVWLGTCIGQGNHCRFWWYIFEESVLSVWTSVMYIMSINKEIYREWWRGAFEILLIIALLLCLIILLVLLIFHSYLVLTNQTTYELIRRRRIPYLRGFSDRVHPFSKGLMKNLRDFCCSCAEYYTIYSLPTSEELEDKERPYTCWDILTCRCC